LISQKDQNHLLIWKVTSRSKRKRNLLERLKL